MKYSLLDEDEISLVQDYSFEPRIKVNTVGENVIGVPKMQNNFRYPFYCSSNFAIAKVVALHLFASFFVLVL